MYGTGEEGNSFRHALVRNSGFPDLVWGPWGGPLVTLQVETDEVERQYEAELRKCLKDELRKSKAELRRVTMSLREFRIS